MCTIKSWEDSSVLYSHWSLESNILFVAVTCCLRGIKSNCGLLPAYFLGGSSPPNNLFAIRFLSNICKWIDIYGTTKGTCNPNDCNGTFLTSVKYWILKVFIRNLKKPSIGNLKYSSLEKTLRSKFYGCLHLVGSCRSICGSLGNPK